MIKLSLANNSLISVSIKEQGGQDAQQYTMLYQQSQRLWKTQFKDHLIRAMMPNRKTMQKKWKIKIQKKMTVGRCTSFLPLFCLPSGAYVSTIYLCLLRLIPSVQRLHSSKNIRQLDLLMPGPNCTFRSCSQCPLHNGYHLKAWWHFMLYRALILLVYLV